MKAKTESNSKNIAPRRVRTEKWPGQSGKAKDSKVVYVDDLIMASKQQQQ